MKTLEQFIKDAIKIHGNKYDYSKVIYRNNDTKIIIICKEHGEFTQTPRAHLQMRGCPQCGRKKTIGKDRKSFLKNRLKFFEKVSETHNQRYTYDVDSFLGILSHIRVFCNIHGEFLQAARVHKRGSGCPDCARKGFNPNKPAFLYLLVTDSNFVGFGISGKVKDRLYRHKLNLKVHNIEIVSVLLFSDTGKKVLICEKYIKDNFANTKVMIEGFKTEAFTPDRLNDALNYLESQMSRTDKY